MWFTTWKVFQLGERQEIVGRADAGPKLCPPGALRAVDIHREKEDEKDCKVSRLQREPMMGHLSVPEVTGEDTEALPQSTQG